MDMIIITSAVIIGVIALIEVLTYFFILPDEGIPDSVAVLPVFSDDKNFPMRLECLIRRNSRNVILVDYSADSSQTELCRQFVRDNPDAVFISHEEIERIFAETFAINA